MNVQQILLTAIASILLTISLYHFFLSIYVSLKHRLYLYFSFSAFGAFMFSFFALLMTAPNTQETWLLLQRLRMSGLMLCAAAGFFCIYDLYFQKSRAPKLFLWLTLIFALTVPTPLFLSLPIRVYRIKWAGVLFEYHYASNHIGHSLYALSLMLFFCYSIGRIMRCHQPKVSKMFGIIALLPPVIAGFNDFAVAYDWLKSIMISEYMIFMFPLSIFILFLRQEKQDYERLQKLHQKLEEEVLLRTKELTIANEHLQLKIVAVSESEAAMQQAKNFLDKIIETSQDSIVVVNMHGFITRVNASYLELVGYPVDEVIGKKITDFTPQKPGVFDSTAGESVALNETFFNSVNEMMHTMRTTGKIKNWTTYYLRQDNTLVPLEANIILLLDDKGQPMAWVGLLRDITERKKAEQAAIVAQKMTAVGRLAGGIAHDFNNLLCIIMGNVSMAKEYVLHDPVTLKMLTNAEKALMQASSLTRKFITFSTGGEPVKEATEMHGWITNTVNKVLGDGLIKCRFSFPENSCWVEIDQEQMSHVFQNIVENAMEAMPEGGEIVVFTELIPPGSPLAPKNLPMMQEKYLKIGIEDHGIGIPGENLGKIFDPYFSTKSKGTQKGMGLGLSTAYSIISKHDGYIQVESIEGAGTDVYIYLPVMEK